MHQRLALTGGDATGVACVLQVGVSVVAFDQLGVGDDLGRRVQAGSADDDVGHGAAV